MNKKTNNFKQTYVSTNSNIKPTEDSQLKEVIRNARQSDVGRIAEILVFNKRMTYRDIFQDDLYSFNELQVLQTIDSLNCRDMNSILVYDDGILKGMLSSQSLIKPNKIWELDELYVDYFFQDSGIGRKLLEKYLKIAKVHDIKKVYTWVVEKNYLAIRFYTNLGFTITDEKQFVEGTSEFEIKMEYKVAE